jgi:tetratricopeptide (TPR) repeat protein
MSADPGAYRAFISYSHVDTAHADWLHRQLEAYRVPPRLVGTATALGPVPSRLTPVFRDRDELPAAGDLSDELRKALQRSLFLIVIASPASARSRWVDEEVRLFKQLHGEGRVLVLIVDGTPGGDPAAECLAPSLRCRIGADGRGTGERAEPIAADLRPEGDGRRLAKLKLVAGLTGLPLDALVQRENARRQRRLAALATLAGALAIAMAVLALVAVRGQAEAERQRAQADGLVEFMLTDLRERLEPVGRLEIFDAVGQRALAYYGMQDLDALDADALGRRARALHLVGEVRDLRGDSQGALDAFVLAERSTAELLERHPGDPQRLFDHAQSVFWVGYIAWQRKALADAERHFVEYHRLATALVAIDPDQQAWQDELASALSNLGVLFQESQRYAEAADRFGRALAIAQAGVDADPADRGRQWSLAQAHAWLADALHRQGKRAAAREQRQLELGVLEGMLAIDARDAEARQGKAVSLSQIANLDLLAGDIAAADEAAHAALALVRELLAEDPDNRFRQELVVLIGNRATEALLLDARFAEAAPLNRDALERAAALAVDDATVAARRSEGLMTARWMDIALRFALEGCTAGRTAIDRFSADFGSEDQVATGAPSDPWAMVLAMDALDRAAAGDHAGAADRVAALRAMVPQPAQPRERAILRFLGTALGIDTPPDDAPAPDGAAGYDPGAILRLAQGTRPCP